MVKTNYKDDIPFSTLPVVVFLCRETLSSHTLHCKKNSIYVFLFWELRGCSLNFHIHVSLSDLYIPRIGPHISCKKNRQIDRGNTYIAHRHMNVKIGTGLWPRSSFSGNICFKLSVLVLCSVHYIHHWPPVRSWQRERGFHYSRVVKSGLNGIYLSMQLRGAAAHWSDPNIKIIKRKNGKYR